MAGTAWCRLVAVIVALLLVTACGGSDSEPTEVGTEPGATPGEQTADAAEETSEITILTDEVATGLNYDGAGIPTPASQTGVVNLMDSLVAYAPGEVNDEGIRLLDFSQFEGRLAESWEFDEEALTWTFRLRQGVVGCDGQEFNADDVLYTFARAKSVSGDIPVSWSLLNRAGVEGFTPDGLEEGADTTLGDEITKVDDYTVQFTLAEPRSPDYFLRLMAHFPAAIFDKETMEENATDEDQWSHEYTNTVTAPGFGPYCLEDWVQGTHFIVTANEEYYRGRPEIGRVVYRKVPQSSNRFAALVSGDAQLVERLTQQEFSELRDRDGIRVAGGFLNENTYLHLNWAVEPLDDPLIRQAIAHAIPYDQIIEQGYFGQAQKWEGHIGSAFPGYIEPEAQSGDPDEAQRLLGEAGYPGGEGLEAFGDAFQLSYVSERESTLGPVATFIQAALTDVGIPIELNPLPSSDFTDRLRNRRDLPMALNDQDRSDVIDMGWAIPRIVGATSATPDYPNPRVAELATEALSVIDTEERDALFAEAQELLQADLNWVPIVEWKTQWAFADNLEGITLHGDTSLRWYDLSLGT